MPTTGKNPSSPAISALNYVRNYSSVSVTWEFVTDAMAQTPVILEVLEVIKFQSTGPVRPGQCPVVESTLHLRPDDAEVRRDIEVTRSEQTVVTNVQDLFHGALQRSIQTLAPLFDADRGP